MTAYLNVGYNWDMELAHWMVNEFPRFAEENDVKIGSVYASLRNDPVGSARPESRIPEISFDDAVKQCNYLRSNGIKVNYTLNSFCLGEKLADEDIAYEIFLWAESLWKHVDIFTVSSVELMHFLHEELKDLDLQFEVSTILDVRDLNAVFEYNDMFGSELPVSRICLSLWANRNKRLLKSIDSARKHCPSLPVCELLVNEFCSVGGSNCHGIYRDNCYMNHSHGVSGGADSFPMVHCIKSRAEDPASWIKARFILPQWMSTYERMGFNHFKLTGRTHKTEFIKSILRSYGSREHNGNLLDLWAQLETINSNTTQSGAIDASRLIIDSTKLGDSSVIKDILRESSKCDYVRCGKDCRFCDSLFDRVATVRSCE